MKRAGYEVSWSNRSFGGYPFRMDITLTAARLREPSGWALEAPKLEGEAYMHGLGVWLIAAPDSTTSMCAATRKKAILIRHWN